MELAELEVKVGILESYVNKLMQLVIDARADALTALRLATNAPAPMLQTDQMRRYEEELADIETKIDAAKASPALSPFTAFKKDLAHARPASVEAEEDARQNLEDEL